MHSVGVLVIEAGVVEADPDRLGDIDVEAAVVEDLVVAHPQRARHAGGEAVPIVGGPAELMDERREEQRGIGDALVTFESEVQSIVEEFGNNFEKVYPKRTVLADFRHSGRGTQGVMAIKASDRNGKVVAAKLVTDEDEIMLITTGGVLIRTRVSEIRELGRATQGVTLISLDSGEKLAGLEKIVETDDADDAAEEA